MNNVYYKVVARSREGDTLEVAHLTLPEAEATFDGLVSEAQEKGEYTTEAWSVFMGADCLVLLECAFGDRTWPAGGVVLRELDLVSWREVHSPDAE